MLCETMASTVALNEPLKMYRAVPFLRPTLEYKYNWVFLTNPMIVLEELPTEKLIVLGKHLKIDFAFGALIQREVLLEKIRFFLSINVIDVRFI